jgi:hypothetical protein
VTSRDVTSLATVASSLLIAAKALIRVLDAAAAVLLSVWLRAARLSPALAACSDAWSAHALGTSAQTLSSMCSWLYVAPLPLLSALFLAPSLSPHLMRLTPSSAALVAATLAVVGVVGAILLDHNDLATRSVAGGAASFALSHVAGRGLLLSGGLVPGPAAVVPRAWLQWGLAGGTALASLLFTPSSTIALVCAIGILSAWVDAAAANPDASFPSPASSAFLSSPPPLIADTATFLTLTTVFHLLLFSLAPM